MTEIRAIDEDDRLPHGDLEIQFIKRYRTLLAWAMKNEVCVYCVIAKHFEFLSGIMDSPLFDIDNLNDHLEQMNLGMLVGRPVSTDTHSMH